MLRHLLLGAIVLIVFLGCDGSGLRVDPDAPQDELQLLVWALEGRSIEIADGVDFVLQKPTDQHAEVRWNDLQGPGRAGMTYGDFRQTGELQASYICPTLGTVTFQISQDSIRWQMNGIGRGFVGNVTQVDVGSGGAVACGPKCGRVLEQIARQNR